MSLKNELLSEIGKTTDVDPNEIERQKINMINEILSDDNLEFLTDTPSHELNFWVRLENFADNPLPIYNERNPDRKIIVSSLQTFITIYKRRQVSRGRARAKELMEAIKAMFRHGEQGSPDIEQRPRFF